MRAIISWLMIPIHVVKGVALLAVMFTGLALAVVFVGLCNLLGMKLPTAPIHSLDETVLSLRRKYGYQPEGEPLDTDNPPGGEGVH
jgi:hypothetical protein